MIKEIENRRSIRKYKRHEISKEIIEDIIYSATLAPSAKNRQPWKFIVYQGEEKSKLVDVMCRLSHGNTGRCDCNSVCADCERGSFVFPDL